MGQYKFQLVNSEVLVSILSRPQNVGLEIFFASYTFAVIFCKTRHAVH